MADEQWMNYRAAGELLGITPEAARHRARRFRWRTRKDNDGKSLILVPDDEVGRTGVERVLSGRAENAATHPVQRPVQQDVQAPLNDLVAVLKDQLAKAEKAREQDAGKHLADLVKIEALLAATTERHAADVAWHRAEIERLNALISRPWWRKIIGS